MSLKIRAAKKEDVPQILAFIRDLATYEKPAHEVTATEADLTSTLFGENPKAEVIFAELDNHPVGLALFFHNYSTFLGRPGIYLEDLFVRAEARGKGIGRALLAHLAALAVSRGCGRLEWAVLDWNEPAIGFYESIGAKAMDEWTVFRLSGDALRRLAGGP